MSKLRDDADSQRHDRQHRWQRAYGWKLRLWYRYGCGRYGGASGVRECVGRNSSQRLDHSQRRSHKSQYSDSPAVRDG